MEIDKEANFTCKECSFKIDFIHGVYDTNNEMAYTDNKTAWHDVPEWCMLVVSSEPVMWRDRMWWQRKSKEYCLKCGGKMVEMFKDGPISCNECGFSTIQLDDGKLSYRIRGREWQTVPEGFLMVGVGEEERDIVKPAKIR